MRKTVYITFFCIIILSGCASMKDSEIIFLDSPKYAMIDLDLQLINFSPTDEDLRILLKITNITDKDIAIPKFYIYFFDEDGYETNGYIFTLFNHWIHFKNEMQDELEYYDIMASIYVENITLDDCVIIKAGESISIEFPNIYHSYGFDNFSFKELYAYYEGPLMFNDVTFLLNDNTKIIRIY